MSPLANLLSLPRSKNAIAQPWFPIRPVLPILWTYSSISMGRSKLITILTSAISNPRAAIAVAIKTGAFPDLKSLKAHSRSSWDRSLKTKQNQA